MIRISAWEVSLCLGVPVVCVYAVFSLYLYTVYRTLKFVRPEHRQETPSRVWLCLVPFVGNVYAVWLVGAVARSLHSQFTALGEKKPVALYGLEEGRVWTVSALVAVCGPILLITLGRILPVDVTSALVAAFLTLLTILGIVSVPCFPKHWYDLSNFRKRLEHHFQTDYTQDEFDYADDLPPPDRTVEGGGP